MTFPQKSVDSFQDEREQQALRYRLLMDRTQDLILFMRMDGQIVEANAAAVATYGYDHETLRRLNIRDLRDATTTPAVPGQMATANSDGILFETRHRRADGTSFPVEVSSIGADLDGERLLISVIRDCTVRYEAKQKLEESEQLLDRAMVAGGMFAFTWVIESGQIDRTESGALVLGGDVPQADTWNRYISSVHAADREHYQELFLGLSPTMASYSTLYRYVRRDGTIAVIEESGAGEFDDQDELVRVRGLAADVTERRRSESERRQLTELLAQTSEPIFVWELDGVITSWNAGAEALYGYTPDEALGQSAHSLLRTIHPIPWQEIRTTLEAEGQWLGALIHHTRDGRQVTVESRKKLAVIDGQRLVMESNRDITEQKRLERMQREFIALAAHELKTPLTSLKGFAQLLQRGVHTESSLETIVKQVNRLDRLVSDLLDISRLDTGRLELRRGELDLVPLLDQLVNEAQASTDIHRLALMHRSEPVLGEWDEDRLTQAFQNLLSNAIKYSPDGGPIEVTIRPGDHEVVVSIRDHGLGVSADDLPRIFQRFQRLDAAKDAAGGLGLGLSITHALVAAHGGRVWAESSGEGHGTTFLVALPTLNEGAA